MQIPSPPGYSNFMTPHFYDIHAHVNFKAFKEDGDAVMEDAASRGVWMNLVGSQIDTSRRAVAMAHRYPQGVFAVVGLHPIHLVESFVDEEEDHFATRCETFDSDAYRALARGDDAVVAIGECGLDYYRLAPAKRFGKELSIEDIIALQHETLRAQVALAKDLNLALMLHCRQDAKAGGAGSVSQNAYDDQYRILKEMGATRGVMHSFCGTLEQAKKFIDLGVLISISGIVTFKNADVVREVVRAVPLDMLTIDTDSPYLAPEPKRGTRNVPTNIEFIAAKIAEIKGESVDRVAEVTTANARRVFGC